MSPSSFAIHFVWTLLCFCVSVSGLAQEVCDVSAESVVLQPDAQAYIGAVLSLREAGQGGVACGGVAGDIQAYEALRWALNRINQDSGQIDTEVITNSYIPGVKLGVMVHDTCSRSQFGAHSILDFVPQIHASQGQCTASNSTLFLGVLGETESSLTAPIAQLLGEFGAPQITYQATDTSLADNKLYPSLLRTISSDNNQIKVVAAVLKSLDWSAVAVIHTAGDEASKDVQTLLTEAQDGSFCVLTTVELPSTGASLADYNNAAAKVLAAGATAVVYIGSKETLLQMFAAVKDNNEAGRIQWIVSDRDKALGVSDLQSVQYGRGVITVAPTSRHIAEFENHWVTIDPNNPSTEDPWFKEWYMETNQCKLSGSFGQPYDSYNECADKDESTRRAEYVQSRYTEAAVTSVYVYARALKNAHSNLCGGTPGVCSALLSLPSEEFFTDYLKPLDFTFARDERIATFASRNLAPYNKAKRVRFDKNGCISDVSYSIWNFNDGSGGFTLEQVGTYIGGVLNLDQSDITLYDQDRAKALASLPRSVCTNTLCKTCMHPSSMAQNLRFGFAPGDVMIGGVFSVHEQGDTEFSCGSIDNHNGAQLMQAYMYALSSVNSKGILNTGVTLGGLGLDDCSSSSLASQMVSNIKTGITGLKGSDGIAVDVKYLQAMVGGKSDAIAVDLASVLKYFGIPLVSYEAMSPMLTDDFELTARTVPGIAKQMRTIALVLERLGWSYVQVIYPADNYGDEALSIVKDTAAKQGICVAASHAWSDSTQSRDVVSALKGTSEAKAVIFLGDEAQYRDLLRALEGANAQKNFTILTGTELGRSVNLIQGVEGVAEGNIAVAYRNLNIQDYVTYLRNIDPMASNQNPWFREWYESVFQCYLDPANQNGWSKECTTNQQITSAPGYLASDYVISVINAVTAIAHGVHKTLQKYCGDSYDRVCSSFLDADERGEVLLQNILSSKFTDESGESFSFNTREADRDMDVYKIDQGRFIQIGSFDPALDQLTMDETSVNSISASIRSTCAFTDCNQCLYMYHSDKHNYMYTQGDFLIGGLLDVHVQGNSPFACGQISDAGSAQLAEGFKFALDRINSGNASVKLNGVKLGGILFDDCSSPTKGASVASNFHSGRLMLDGGVDTDQVVAWLTQSSDVTLQAADILSQLNISQIGISADAYYLKDNDRLETFYSMITNGAEMAKALTNLLLTMQWKYIQVVHARDQWSESLVSALRAAAAEASVCILGRYEIGSGPSSTDDIVSNLVSSTTDVVVVVGSQEDIRNMISSKQKAGSTASKLRFVVAMDYEGRLEDVSKGLAIATSDTLAVRISPSGQVPGFDQYISTLIPGQYMTNPWFAEYYESVFQCNLKNNYKYSENCDDVDSMPVINGANYKQNEQLISIINAVYATAHALDLVLKDSCGADYNGICDGFPQSATDVRSLVLAKLADVSFTDVTGSPFLFTDGAFDQGYTIYRFDDSGKYTEVSSYQSGSLTSPSQAVRDLYDEVSSQCVIPCLQCQYLAQSQEEFTYTDGDIIIGGIFDVHKKGDGPFTCGDINLQHGAQLLEAFNFALDTVNSKSGIFSDKLQGVTVGGLGLDACQSPTRAGSLLSNVHSGMLDLDSGDQDVATDKVDVYVGAFDSDTSMQMASILNVLDIAQISYGSTSTELNNKDSYPLFFRTVPADDQQARAMVAFLRRFDLAYVQVVHSEGIYGERASTEFVKYASDYSICVAQTIKVEDANSGVSPEMAKSVIHSLLMKPKSNAIVLFLKTDSIKPLLDQVALNSDAASRFKFLGSDAWADDPNVVQGSQNIAQKAATFGVETSDLTDFDTYLLNIDPRSYTRDPWFAKYYEYVCGCSLGNDPASPFTDECAAAAPGIVRGCPYQQDPYVLYTVNAVYSAALGIHNALVEACGESYSGLCDSFTNSADKRTLIKDGIQKAMFVDATQQIFKFTDEGESSRGYHIYNVRQSVGRGTILYEKVGSYNDTHQLKIDARYNLNWQSDCSGEGACSECPGIDSQRPQYMSTVTTDGFNLIGFFPIHAESDTDPYTCGSLQMTKGFQNALAFQYVLEQINRNPSYFRPASLTLGGVAMDTCGNSLAVTRDVYSLLSGLTMCLDGQNPSMDSVAAIVTMTDDDTKASTTLLSPVGVTTISTSTSTAQDGETNVLRTLPKAETQGQAMVEIAKRMSWSYVSMVYTDDAYGRTASSAFIKASQGRTSSTCLGSKLVMSVDATMDDAVQVIQSLKGTDGASVVMLFTTSEHSRMLLQAAQQEGIVGRFTFIGGDSLGSDPHIFDDLEIIGRGSVVVKVDSPVVEGFLKYMSGLNVANHGNIPDAWFEEFWQHLFQCELQNATVKQSQYVRICSRSDRITSDLIDLDPSVLHTIIGTQIVAKGLRDVGGCSSSSLGIPGCLSQLPNKRQLIYDEVRQSTWEASPSLLYLNESFRFAFTSDGYGNLGYSVYNYDRSGGTYSYQKFGQYTQGSLSLQKEKYRGYDSSGTAKSTIISQCRLGTVCTCLDDTGGPNGGLSGGGSAGGANDPSAQPVVKTNENFTKAWGIIMTVLTGLGLICALLMFVYLVIFYPIKGGTTPVAYLLLFGIMLIYTLNFAFIVQADAAVCGIRRFCLAFVYALCFSCLLVKTINNWRLGSYLDDFMPPTTKRVAHPAFLLVIVIAMTLVQVGFGVEWLILEPPDYVMYHDAAKDTYTPRCLPTDFHYEELIISCVYPMFLMLLTLIFSVLTWDSEENHRECRWILISTCFTIGIWIVWTVVASILDWKFRDPAITIANFVNATVILLCIFARKLYLLNKYEKEAEKGSTYVLELDNDKGSGVQYEVYTNQMFDPNGTLGSRHSRSGGSRLGYEPASPGADVQY